MKLNKLILGMTLGSMVVPTLAQATPRKYNKCSIDVQMPNGADKYFFSKDCKTVYVTPPKFGIFEVGNYDPAPALESECSVIRDAKKEAEVDQANSLKMATLRTKLVDRAVELESLLDKGLVPVGETEESILTKIVDLNAKTIEMKKQTDEIFEMNYLKIDRFANEMGADGLYYLDNGFAQLVEEFKSLNEGSGLTFEQMPLDQSFLTFNEKTSEDTTIPHRFVLELGVPGIDSFPILSALGTFLDENSGTPYEKVPDGAVLFNGGISGELIFSKIGACAVLEDLGGVKTFNLDDVKGKVAANNSYQYQVQVTRKYSVTYNLAEFWRRFQEQGRRGGLFSSSSFSNLIDTKRSNSWITFHSQSEDVQFEYSDEDIEEIKKEFIDRAITQALAAKTGDPKAYLTLLDPGKNGAKVVGEELGKCPHLYCQVGAAGFKILDAIFGSSHSSSELIQTFDQTSKQTEIHDRMVTQFGTSAFK